MGSATDTLAPGKYTAGALFLRSTTGTWISPAHEQAGTELRGYWHVPGGCSATGLGGTASAGAGCWSALWHLGCLRVPRSSAGTTDTTGSLPVSLGAYRAHVSQTAEAGLNKRTGISRLDQVPAACSSNLHRQAWTSLPLPQAGAGRDIFLQFILLPNFTDQWGGDLQALGWLRCGFKLITAVEHPLLFMI